ncbi:putative subunit 2 of cleavage stimulation factor [Chloropicon primus]|uniref:Putative subunit 2 of cleavage stimulation factor n=2 Tax=Chloropicon primus TaxID=1764295 RepID=A0A5B8MDR9_9CHLO|nr:putative subunit 2 of cleavage stimulation factor [Chloropicon primus]UPQ97792.1 putative subunit 2 of cleavage stimulation factor [Chloropicon primus]|eukprot:QDZ18583.1 putative subunit 2 of cleavage stimulation factor [Chloropicon primus]
MSNRKPCSTVFVGNIFYEVTEDMLVKLLSEVGPVKSLRLVCDRETGKPKGYGFCEFYDVMTADSAVRNLDGRELSGRNLRIDFADEGTKGGAEGTGSARLGRAGQGQSVGIEAASAAAVSIGGQKGDEVAKVLADMSKQELWELLEQTKALVAQNPQQARQLLINNPGLTKAIFQAQIILGIIKTQGVQGGGMMGQGQVGMGVPGVPQPYPAPGVMNGGNQMMHQPPMGMHQPQPPMGMGMGMQPAGPGGMQNFEQQQQELLLQQLLSMTPEQIAMLPPDQKQQVLEVQAQLKQQG